MKYKIADQDELIGCNALIKDTGCYGPVDLRDIGGMTIIGSIDEKIVTCVWLCVTGTRVYLDYLTAARSNKGAAVRLLVKCHAMLAKLGAKEVKFLVLPQNEEIFKIARQFGAKSIQPYILCEAMIGEYRE